MYGAAQYYPSGTSAREISASVEEAIRTGALSAGDTLPTVRSLAAVLGLSPATVATAYRELGRRGTVAAAGRAGTRVRGRPPIAVRLPMVVPSGVRDLRGGGPDPALLPPLPPLPAPRRPARLYGAPPVSPDLASVAGARLAADGIDASHLAVVGGALDGIERVLAAWLHPGDRVAVEDPGYSAVIDLLGALGLVPVPVAVDHYGARPEGVAAAIERGVRAVVVTPRAQNPTGAAWDGARAEALVAALERAPDVLVVEDDHAGPAAGVAAVTICSGRDRWATVRSVSKWLGPDLRLAVLAGDPTTVSRVEGRQSLGTGWVSYLLQDAVATMWGDPATQGILEVAATTYARRRRALLEALVERGFAPTGTSGLTTWVPVADEHGVVAGLAEGGWAVSPGERFRLSSAPGIRIALATLEEEEAPAFAAAFERCVRARPMREG